MVSKKSGSVVKLGFFEAGDDNVAVVAVEEVGVLREEAFAFGGVAAEEEQVNAAIGQVMRIDASFKAGSVAEGGMEGKDAALAVLDRGVFSDIEDAERGTSAIAGLLEPFGEGLLGANHVGGLQELLDFFFAEFWL